MITNDYDSCTATGLVFEDGTLDWSHIQSELIIGTGRFCDYNANDIFDDLMSIQKKINERKLKTETIWFGFRDCGIDHETTIRDTLLNPKEYGFSPYREIWKLEIIAAYKKYHSIYMELSKATSEEIEEMLGREGE